MTWLVYSEALIGMLLVLAVIRSRGARRLFASEDSAEMNAPLTRVTACWLVYLIRQFAIRILGAEWRRVRD